MILLICRTNYTLNSTHNLNCHLNEHRTRIVVLRHVFFYLDTTCMKILGLVFIFSRATEFARMHVSLGAFFV